LCSAIACNAWGTTVASELGSFGGVAVVGAFSKEGENGVRSMVWGEPKLLFWPYSTGAAAAGIDIGWDDADGQPRSAIASSVWGATGASKLGGAVLAVSSAGSTAGMVSTVTVGGWLAVTGATGGWTSSTACIDIVEIAGCLSG
jgi:hypothetical protein